MNDDKKSVSEQMQDELEPILHPSPEHFDESDEIESLKRKDYILKPVSYTHLTLPTNREV